MMLSTQECITIAGQKLIDLYGKEYMREHFFNDSVHSRGNLPGDIFQFFCAFEGSKKRPDLTPNDKGWTVYATIHVNRNTGKTEVIDCVLPDGKIIS